MDLYRLSDTTRNSLWIEADGNHIRYVKSGKTWVKYEGYEPRAISDLKEKEKQGILDFLYKFGHVATVNIG